jgi:hypothetical protein
MLSASAQQSLDILYKGSLGSSDASIKVSYIIASNITALSPVNKGEQLIKAAIEGLRDLVLLATRA